MTPNLPATGRQQSGSNVHSSRYHPYAPSSLSSTYTTNTAFSGHRTMNVESYTTEHRQGNVQQVLPAANTHPMLHSVDYNLLHPIVSDQQQHFSISRPDGHQQIYNGNMSLEGSHTNTVVQTSNVNDGQEDILGASSGFAEWADGTI